MLNVGRAYLGAGGRGKSPADQVIKHQFLIDVTGEMVAGERW